MSDDSRKALRAKGLKIRTEVLGRKYVDAALNNVTAFNGGLQDLLNEYCWGAGWGSEGLTRRERSLINLAMLTALGRTHEVAVHVRGAKNNGLSNEQIAAVFLQTAIYCGVPAAVDSFRAANPVITEWDAENAASAKSSTTAIAKRSNTASSKASSATRERRTRAVTTGGKSAGTSVKKAAKK